MIDKTTSRKIADMSLFSAFLIVSLHVFADFTVGSLPYFCYWVLRGLDSIAVPYYCVVSGFFLAVHMGEEKWWFNAVRKRFSSLVFPFFFWNVTAWAFYAVLHFIAASRGIPFSADCVEGVTFGRVCSWLGFSFFDYPMHGHYWYVRMLFLFVLVSPLFALCRRCVWHLFILLALLMVFNRFQVQNTPWTFFLEWTFPIRCLFFISIGIFLSQYDKDDLRFGNAIRILSSRSFGILALAVGGILLLLRGGGMVLPPEIDLLKTLCLLLGVWDLWPQLGVSSIVHSCAFPIFTLHWFITRIVQIVLKVIHHYDDTRSSFTVYVLSLLVAWVGSFLLAISMRRFSPRFSKLVFGR